MDNTEKTILSVFDYTGNWSKPYRDAGYNVVQIDIQHGQDVRTLEHPGKVHGIILQPPCDHFAVSGARWWEQKGVEALVEGLQLVDAGLRLVVTCEPTWWVLENPVGRLKHYLGPYQHIFNPCDYGGYLDPPGDKYTKKTCLWGKFSIPEKKPVDPSEGSKMHKVPPGPERKNIRSATPMGFAKAFFEANP